MPMGAVIARYLKVFKSADPAWFYLHVACQTSAYIVGVAGFATGIKLGSDSPSITYDKHRNIGITLFCMGTLQVLPYTMSCVFVSPTISMFFPFFILIKHSAYLYGSVSYYNVSAIVFLQSFCTCL